MSHDILRHQTTPLLLAPFNRTNGMQSRDQAPCVAMETLFLVTIYTVRKQVYIAYLSSDQNLTTKLSRR